jgi:hypothetical protein
MNMLLRQRLDSTCSVPNVSGELLLRPIYLVPVVTGSPGMGSDVDVTISRLGGTEEDHSIIRFQFRKPIRVMGIAIPVVAWNLVVSVTWSEMGPTTRESISDGSKADLPSPRNPPFRG